MMAVIEPQFQRDFISLLPKVSQHLRQPSKLLADPGVVQELALYVLSYLEPRDLLRAAQTCRYWRVLAEDNLLWREKCREVPAALHCTAPHCTLPPCPALRPTVPPCTALRPTVPRPTVPSRPALHCGPLYRAA